MGRAEVGCWGLVVDGEIDFYHEMSLGIGIVGVVRIARVVGIVGTVRVVDFLKFVGLVQFVGLVRFVGVAGISGVGMALFPCAHDRWNCCWDHC
jgi:hypothetical protein